jgi:hypothetical protein
LANNPLDYQNQSANGTHVVTYDPDDGRQSEVDIAGPLPELTPT